MEPQPRQDGLPEGLAHLPPQVAVEGCQECGREASDEYTLYIPLADYEGHLNDIDWFVQDGRVLCFDCAKADPDAS